MKNDYKLMIKRMLARWVASYILLLTFYVAAQDEAFRIDGQFKYEFDHLNRQGPIKLVIQDDNFRMDWFWPNVDLSMIVLDKDVYLLSKEKGIEVPQFAFISSADDFPIGELIAEAMYLMLNLGKLDKRQQITRLQNSLFISGDQLTLSKQDDKASSNKGIRTMKVYGRKNGKKVSLLERLFGRKEFQCIQVDYIDSTAVKDFGDLVSEPMTFRVASEPLGGGRVFESIQFQFEKVKSVSISEQNPLLPSLKSIDGMTVSDSRFKDQLSRDSISYTIQDGTWPRRDAEVVRQALERALKLKQ